MGRNKPYSDDNGRKRKIGISEKLLFLIFGIVFGLGGELMSILAYKTKERVEFVAPPKQSLLKDIAMLRYNKILIYSCLRRFSTSSTEP